MQSVSILQLSNSRWLHMLEHACSCPNELDSCDLETGQCSNCPPLVGGRTCNVCVANSFGYPSIGCTVSLIYYPKTNTCTVLYR